MEEQITPAPPSVSTTQPVPVKTKKKSNLPIIVISLVVISLIVAGVIYAKKFLNKPKACTSEARVCPDGSSVGRTGPNCEFAPCPSVIPTTIPTIDETANWKTYEDKIYNFNFNYPENMTYKQNNQSGLSQVVFEDSQGSVFDFRIMTSFSEGQEKYFLDAEPIGKREIGGIEWNVYSLPKGYCDMEECTSAVFAVQGKKDNVIYSLAFYNQSSPNSLTNQILSTFKFTNLPDDLITLVKSKAKADVGNDFGTVEIGQYKIIGDFAEVAWGFTDGPGAVYWAVRNNGVWKIVASGQEPPPCTTLSQYNFPKEFECNQ